MTTILNGLLGGAIVGVVATLAAKLARGEQRAKPVGSTGTESTASRWRTSVPPVAYGSAAGCVLVALELFVLDALAVPPSLGEAFAVAVAWSVVLLVGMLAILRFVPEMQREELQPGVLAVYHFVFGVGFGVWIRMTWIT